MNPLEVPKLEKYVNDFSGVLSTEELSRLNELFAEHERTTSEQVVTVFFPHRKGSELLDIGLKIFNENGIGQKNLNNGILLIIATEEKKIRIITGKGMEIKYSEMKCRDIIEDSLRDLLSKSDYQNLLISWLNISTENKKPYVDFTKEDVKIAGGLGGQSNKSEIKDSNNLIKHISYCMLFLFAWIVIAGIQFCEQNRDRCYSSSTYSSSQTYGSKSHTEHRSSSFSFGGGGGSSNGGGYGD